MVDISQKRPLLSRWWFYPLVTLVSLAAVAMGVALMVIILLYPTLPDIDSVTDYKPKIPLRIFSAEDELIAEYGEEKRSVVTLKDVPDAVKLALIAAEDERFYAHGGVDVVALGRVGWAMLSGGKKQGGGTLTMQVAREFYLSRDRTLSVKLIVRKLSEMLLAIKIEQNLSKDQILELYLNQMFLGYRLYGFQSASGFYFGKPLRELNVAEAAVLVGILPAPSRYNPYAGNGWKPRQRYVLNRMRNLQYISAAQYDQAIAFPVVFNPTPREYASVDADFVGEMARQFAVEQYTEAAMVAGIRVYTTIRKADQDAANLALKRGVMDYDRRHGYRGPEAFVPLPADRTAIAERVDEALQDRDTHAGLQAAWVVSVDAKQLTALTRRGESVSLSADALKFIGRWQGDPKKTDKVRPGSVIRVTRDEKSAWQITQMPRVESAFVALDPNDGAIIALAGGFDFQLNKFNRVTQAQRQPGSSFKPFIYSAALEKGFTPATLINDAPIVVDASVTGSGEKWEPKNYDGKYEGPMRLRTALAKSKNMVSIRILQAIGPKYAQDYITRFGFAERDHPPYLTMALGAGSTTPMQMASAYAVFANGGYRVKPYLVRKVLDNKGNVLHDAKPTVAGANAERAIDERNAFLMYSIMKDVVTAGTATRAMALGRRDLAGKTGTTNDHFDAWFAGFQPNLVGVAWIGFDNPADLGNDETGGKAALPIWVNYMAKALKDAPQLEPKVPPGIIVVGLEGEPSGKKEYMYEESASRINELRDPGNAKPPEEVRNQIF
jgi:penicillin-binding protein 1A